LEKVFLQTGCPFCHLILQFQSTAVTQQQVVHYQLRSTLCKRCHFITRWSLKHWMYVLHAY